MLSHDPTCNIAARSFWNSEWPEEFSVDAPRFEKYSSVPLFEGLQPEEIGALLGYSETIEVDPGEVVIQEGQGPDYFYVIAEGVLDVVITDKVDEALVLARLSDLSCFGEMGLVSGQPHSASVVAVEKSRLRRFSIARMQELIEMEDRTVYRMILGLARLISARLQSSLDRRVD